MTGVWRDASILPFWLDKAHRPTARPALEGHETTDLAVVGAGYSGLWTALLAKERNPERSVVVHLDEIEETIARYGIDCAWERNGTLSVATEAWQEPSPGEHAGSVLDREGVQAEINSPRYVAGVWEKNGSATLDPAELAWGLARACEQAGVRIFEHSRVDSLRHRGPGVELSTAAGTLRAGQVVLATNAFTPLLRRLRLHTVPVYDYALVTEPLSSDQMASIGWANRQGLSERANQFHYSRLTRDNRILWGGYDAIYHYGRRVRPAHDTRPATFDLLADQFADTFPQLDGIAFTHAWGGAIDTCTRFFAFYGTAMNQKVAYALGFTGLGVAATRFAANVMLDLLEGADTERTRLQLVRRRPLPFPPEPLAYTGIQITRRAIARADASAGRRGPWLRGLDAVGLGFDS